MRPTEARRSWRLRLSKAARYVAPLLVACFILLIVKEAVARSALDEGGAAMVAHCVKDGALPLQPKQSCDKAHCCIGREARDLTPDIDLPRAYTTLRVAPLAVRQNEAVPRDLGDPQPRPLPQASSPRAPPLS